MHPKSFMHLLRLLTIIIPAIVLAGCFGNGSDPDPAPPGTARGVLVNSPIEGAEYATATQSGVTSNTGEFRYIPGEMVTFSVGGIVLGTVAGAPLLTPVELTGSASPGLALAPNAATNQLVFLQSIDADQTTGGYVTGITISPATKAAAQGQTLDFNSPTFAADVVTVVNAIAPPGNMVVTNTTALDNFYETYKALGGSNTFSWPFPGYPPFPPTSAQLLTNGTFEIPDATGGNVGSVPGWTTFESVFTTANDGPSFAPVSHNDPDIFDNLDNQSILMFGPFFTGGASGAFQRVAGVPGATYDLSAWVMNWIGDPFGNLGILQMNFLDATGNGIPNSGIETTVDPFGTAIVDLSVVQDGADISDWTQLSLSAVAPAGTAEVEVFMLHIQTGSPCCSPGSLYWDDVSLIGPAVGSSSGFNTLVWSDEFARGTQLDLTKWTLETGYGASGWGNNEWQEYTNSANNISIDDDPVDPANGHLRISALLDTANCPVPMVGVCGFQDGTITSARITTNPDMMPNQGLAFKYGRIEASIQLPVGGYGTWPAFWMLGEKINSPSVVWPQVGEIDIVEMFGKGGTTNQEAIFTLHWCDETVDPDCVPFPVGYRTNSGKADLGVPLGNNFRVYAAEWDATGVTWSIDGLIYRFTAIQPATMEEFLDDFFIILNVAIGGNPFGAFNDPASAPDATGWPREMLVDWVRVYQ